MDYLYWLTLFVWLPLTIMWAVYWRYLSRYIRTFIYCGIAALAFSIPWDLWAVETHIWSFPQSTHISEIGGLPVEEYLFMIFVTLLVATFALVARRWAESTL